MMPANLKWKHIMATIEAQNIDVETIQPLTCCEGPCSFDEQQKGLPLGTWDGGKHSLMQFERSECANMPPENMGQPSCYLDQKDAMI
jgi:hypothetical protein